MPSSDEVNKALQLMRKREANHEYFFSKLASPDWIEPLDQAGIFSSPPDAKQEGTSISFPFWPEAEYLSRMAGAEPEKVLSIMLKTPQTTNIRVHDYFARAAAVMPGGLAAKWANRECKWLETQQYLVFLLPDSLGKLCQHLAQSGEGKAALRLFHSLFRITDRGKEFWDIKSLLEPWQYEKTIKETYPSILKATGVIGFRQLCNLLDKTLAEGSDENGRTDLSWAMRAAIEPHEQNVSHSSIRDILIDAVRDAGDFLVTQLGRGSEGVLLELDRKEKTLFRRLRLYFLAEHGELFSDEAQIATVSRENFFDSGVFHEYTRLLRNTFPRLRSDLQNQILSWISEGPDVKPSFEDSDLQEKRKQGWQVRWLSILKEVLSPEWRSHYDKLVETIGQPEYPDLLSYSTSGWGLSSPKTDRDLQSMSAKEIAGFLLAWEPMKGWNNPVPEGLGRALQRAVSSSPAKFEATLKDFQGVEATYARAIVQGFEEAAKRDERLSWESVIDFLSWLISRPRDSTKIGSSPLERDPHWGWARRAVASLLGTSFEKDLMPRSLRTVCWALVRQLTDDPDPTPSDEADSSMDAATYSINTTRGEAMHAVIRYALWIRRGLDSSNSKGAGVRSTFEEMPEVREVLEWHLSPENDQSSAVHAVYGQWLPWLILLDRAWVGAHLKSIFPKDEASVRLRNAAWKTYLTFCHAYNDSFQVLQDEYSSALAHLNDAPDKYGHMGDPNVHLGEHLILFAGRGLISPSDESGLCFKFFKHTSDTTAAHALISIGQLLKNQAKEVPQEVVGQFRAMWELLLKSTKLAIGKQTLQAFGWWFASGCFDPSWSLNFLLEVLRLAGGVDADFAVAERLAETVSSDPADSLRALRALIAADKEGWHILGWKESARAVLRVAMANTRTAEEARLTIHILGAKGNLEFRDLLQEQPR